MEKARRMLLEARLPESFWAEVVNTAVYLHNQSPTRSLDNMTPYEAWNSVKPDLSHIKVFGCDAYLFVPNKKRGKLRAKTRKCTNMGYVWKTTKMWRLWDPTGRRVIIGSNVRFDEGSLGGRQPLEIALELEEEPNEGHVERPAEINHSGQGKFQASENPTLSRLSAEYPTPIMSLSPAREPQNEQIGEIEQLVPILSTIDLRQINAVEETEPASPRQSTRVRTQTNMFPGMRAFAARVGKNGEPITLTEALMEEPVEWNRAIADELHSLMETERGPRQRSP